MLIQDKLAIAIPTYNERENVRKLITMLKDMFPRVRIFVVDDNSPDGTARVVKELQQKWDGIKLLCRPTKSGLASAYIRVFEEIMCNEGIEYIATMDADHSHSPSDLRKLLDYAEEFDLVVGSRYVAGGQTGQWSLWRRSLSKFGNVYARFISRVPIGDLTAGFVIYNRSLLAELLDNEITSEGYGFQIEMKCFAHKQHAKIKEVPITFIDRNHGRSKLGKGSIWEGIVMPWYLRFNGSSAKKHLGGRR